MSFKWPHIFHRLPEILRFVSRSPFQFLVISHTLITLFPCRISLPWNFRRIQGNTNVYRHKHLSLLLFFPRFVSCWSLFARAGRPSRVPALEYLCHTGLSVNVVKAKPFFFSQSFFRHFIYSTCAFVCSKRSFSTSESCFIKLPTSFSLAVRT